MKKILFPRGCRSDYGLSDPIIKRLKNKSEFNVRTIQLIPCDFSKSMAITKQEIAKFNPDLIIIVGDRVEMAGSACAAFLKKIPIAHVYAGIINDPITTHDDIFRHCITLWSDIIFTEDETAFANAVRLVSPFKSVDIRTVGISHLDDLVVDECMVPRKPYDLVLINYQPLGDPAFVFKKERLIVQIGGNPDGEILHADESDIYYPNLPRPQFLGLLKNCQRFITNSSAAIYEAPHFLKPEQIVMVGDRNRNRPRGPFRTGASDRIVAILREWLG